jgi:hypothetical protein
MKILGYLLLIPGCIVLYWAVYTFVLGNIWEGLGGVLGSTIFIYPGWWLITRSKKAKDSTNNN